MKKVLTLGFFVILFCAQVSAQVISFQAFDVCYREHDEQGDFNEWSTEQVASDLIRVDVTDRRIKFFTSKRVYNFDIIEISEGFKDSDGDVITEFNVVDDGGRYCWISHVNVMSRDPSFHIFLISYPTSQVRYRASRKN